MFTFRRVLAAIPTLLLLSTLTFFLLRLAPGGPFDSERVWPAEVQANEAVIAAYLGTDHGMAQEAVAA